MNIHQIKEIIKELELGNRVKLFGWHQKDLKALINKGYKLVEVDSQGYPVAVEVPTLPYV